MASKTEMCNITLSHLGTAKQIANIETEQSEEAKACRAFYTVSLEETLRSFPWPFAKRYATLALVSEYGVDDSHPTAEWKYAFRYPANCLTIRKISSGTKVDSEDSEVKYDIGQDDEGLLILTDQAEAVVEYTHNTTDTSLMPVDFIMAHSYRLGYYVAPRLTKGDPFKIKRELQQDFVAAISTAGANALNEKKDPKPVESEFIRGRES